MKKNILLISSSKNKSKPLIDLFEELCQKEYCFYLLSTCSSMLEQFREKNWFCSRISLGPAVTNNFLLFIFLLLSPWLYLKFLVILINYKFKQNISTVLLMDWQEKILVTLLAKIIKLKVVWLEKPDCDYKKLKLKKIYKLCARFATIITVNSDNKIQLKNFGIKEENIFLIQPAIKLNQYQENIFNKIAQTSNKNFHNRYFTIGTIVDLKQGQKVEILLQAIKICLTVIPNLQLIIAGDGKEKKNLSWLTKKMEIDSLVWFIGEQKQIKKWLSNFAVYVVATKMPNIDDYYNILKAMASGLPIIGPRHTGLEEIIIENKTGSLIEMDNSEMLARQIIKLYQDKKMRLQLGDNAQERIKNLFIIDKVINKFIELL
ncbi:MAG: glycosyltransferase [Patescibacteria group bacterium]|nr:glycosyltransferase [Patescibacteria group bacterium]MBU1870894.1 glycosyltransferase [Patescibacteria group bacterium]